MTDPRKQSQQDDSELNSGELEAVAGGQSGQVESGTFGLPEPYGQGPSPNAPGDTDRPHVKKDIFSY